MTTIEIAELCADRPMPRLVFTVPDGLWAFVRRRAERRMYACLARLSPHLIRDAGFDPDVVHDAVAGSWDEVAPGRYRNR